MQDMLDVIMQNQDVVQDMEENMLGIKHLNWTGMLNDDKGNILN